MGKSLKTSEDQRRGNKLRRLFGRHHKSSARIEHHSDGSQQETYRAIGRVNARHLQDSQSWDIKYLGVIPEVKDWQCPESRTEFMQLIDQAQMNGQIMWSSLTPKTLHISPRWLVITDDHKKVAYTEILVASLGSLSYAEDENRHILGIKTTKPATVSDSTLSRGDLPMKGTDKKFCCHILECDSEVVVRQICTLVSEYFRGLMMQNEAVEQLKHEGEQQQQVKTKMLKRLSVPPEQSRSTSRKVSERAEEDGLIHLTHLSKEMSEEEVTPRRPHTSHDEQDKILEKIGQQFMAITKEPSYRQRVSATKKGPNVKRLSIESTGVNCGNSDDELLPPISINKIAHHNGQVVTQELPDASGITITENTDYLVPKRRQRRTGIVNFVDSSSVPKEVVPPPNLQELQSDSPSDESPDSENTLRTSLLLETMEEGEKETRIDGDGKEAILVQTTMGEKETAIIGRKGSALLLPTSQLTNYQETEQQSETSPQSLLPPPTHSPLTLPPSPPPEKPGRTPWSVLIGIDQVPKDPEQQIFLAKVSEALGDIEYSQFRRHWLDYQMCKTNIVQFFKKIKLLLRGSRAHLREGTKVLLDPLDYDDFNDILAGKEVEASKLNPAQSEVVSTPQSSLSGSNPTGPSSLPSSKPTLPPAVPPKNVPPTRTGGLGSRLKMFEQMSPDPNKIQLARDEMPKPGSIARLIQAQESGDIYYPTSEEQPQQRFRSKIAAFEKGIGGTVNDRNDESVRYDDDNRRDHRHVTRWESSNERHEKHGRHDSDDRYGRHGRRDSDDRHGRYGRHDSDDRHGRHGRRESGDRHGRHGKQDSDDRHGKQDSDDRHGKRDNSVDRHGKHDKHKDSREPRGKHGRRDNSRDRQGRHSREDSGEDRHKHKPRKDHHRKKNNEKDHKKKKETKSKENKNAESIGLQGILDAGIEIFKPTQMDDTIHVLSEFLGEEDGRDYLQLTNQFLQKQDDLSAITQSQPTSNMPDTPSQVTHQMTDASSLATHYVTTDPWQQSLQSQQLFEPQVLPQIQDPQLSHLYSNQYIQSAQHAEHVQPAQYIQQTQVVQPPQYIQPAQHVQPLQYIQPGQLMEQVQLPQYIQSAQLVEPTPSIQYVQQSQPMEYMQPVVQPHPNIVQQTQQTQYVQQVHPAPTYTQHTQVQVQPPQVLQPTQQIQPTQQQSTQQIQPIWQVQPTQQVQLTQQPTSQVQPTPQVQQVQLTPYIETGEEACGVHKEHMPQPNFDDSELNDDNVLTRFSDESGETHQQSSNNPPPHSLPSSKTELPPPPEFDPRPPPLTHIPPPPPLPNIPPPPPPPPIENNTEISPPGQSKNSPPNQTNHSQRDELLAQIKEKRQLKKVSELKLKERNTSTKGDVFSEIRSGKQLKKVSESEKNRPRNRFKGRVVETNDREEDYRGDHKHERKHRKERNRKRENERDRREDERDRREDERDRREDKRDRREDKRDRRREDERDRRREDERDRRREDERDRRREDERDRRREDERDRRREDERDRRREDERDRRREDERDRKREDKRDRREEDERGRSQRRKDDRRENERDRKKESEKLEEDTRRRDTSDDEDYYSQDENKSHGRKSGNQQQDQQKIKLIGMTGSHFKGIAKNSESKTMPGWKASLLKRKQEKIDKTPPSNGHMESTEDDIPIWKAALLKKRKMATEEEAKLKQQMEESKYGHLPEWKKELVKKKNAEREKEAQIERQKNQALLDKKAEIAAMPEWKRKLYLQKNPEYQTYDL